MKQNLHKLVIPAIDQYVERFFLMYAEYDFSWKYVPLYDLHIPKYLEMRNVAKCDILNSRVGWIGAGCRPLT